jgi:hypothetical protein
VPGEEGRGDRRVGAWTIRTIAVALPLARGHDPRTHRS